MGIMKRLIIAGTTCLITFWWQAVVCKPVSDSLRDTAVVVQPKQIPDSAESRHPLPESKQAQPDANDTENLQRTVADSGAAHTKLINQSSTTGLETDSSISYPHSGFIAPSFTVDYFIGKNNRLPDGNLFLLGGKDQFIVKKRLSKWLELGLAGGPAFRTPIIEPYSSIDDALFKARLGFPTSYGMTMPDDGSNFLDKIINGQSGGRDGENISITTYKGTDFPGVGLRSLQWYLNAYFPLSEVFIMIKPLIFGEHVLFKSEIYKEKYDVALRSMSFSKLMESTTDFPVRNMGIVADIAINRHLGKYISLYVHCPIDYRKVRLDATSSFIAQFPYYPDDYGYYRRYVKLDTLTVPPGKATYLSYSPRLGLEFNSNVPLSWPFIVLPFIGQKTTLEGYYGQRRLRESGSYDWSAKYHEFGCSLTSFQNIYFGNGFFTGMENLSRNILNCFYNDRFVESICYSEYIPQLILNKRFFFSLFRYKIGYYDSGISFDSYNQYSLGYTSESWGISFSITPKAWFKDSNDPDAFNVSMWRFWK